MKLLKYLLRYDIVVSQIKLWQSSNKLAMASSVVVGELLFYWLIFTAILYNRSFFDILINIKTVGYLWLFTSHILLFYLWIFIVAVRKNSLLDNAATNNYLKYLTIFLYLPYSTYLLYNVNITSIFTGVTLLVTALAGISLIRNRFVWIAFIFHISLVVVLSFLPLFDYHLPFATLYEVNTINIRFSYENYNVFWTIFYYLLSIPKASLGVVICLYLYANMSKKLKYAEYSANFDELTKVKNRRFIMEYLSSISYNVDSKTARLTNPQDISVVIIDLDYFKAINDTYGHLSGDLVLIEVAKRLNESMILDTWQVSRYGGEEFLIVLPETPHNTAMKVAKHIHEQINADPVQIVDGLSVDVTASMGVATLCDEEVRELRDNYRNRANKSKHITILDSEPDHILPFDSQKLVIEALINQADEALYKAKRNGRNQVRSAHMYIDIQVANENKAIIMSIADDILGQVEFDEASDDERSVDETTDKTTSDDDHNYNHNDNHTADMQSSGSNNTIDNNTTDNNLAETNVTETNVEDNGIADKDTADK